MGMFLLSSITESANEQLRSHFTSLFQLFSSTLEDQQSTLVPFYTIRWGTYFHGKFQCLGASLMQSWDSGWKIWSKPPKGDQSGPLLITTLVWPIKDTCIYQLINMVMELLVVVLFLVGPPLKILWRLKIVLKCLCRWSGVVTCKLLKLVDTAWISLISMLTIKYNWCYWARLACVDVF